MRKAYLITAVIFIILSMAIFYFGSELPESRRGVPGPAVWPIIISLGMLASGVILFIVTIKNKTVEVLDLLTNDNIRVYMTMGILTSYFILMNIIGFIVSSLVLMFGLFTWYGNYPLTKRVLLSITTVGMVYGVFNYVLNVPFRFGFLF